MRKDSLSTDQLDWLKEHIDDDLWDALTIKFNEQFGANKTKHALMNKCQREGIYKTDKDVFLSHKAKTQIGGERIRLNEFGQPIIWVKISNSMKRRNSVGNYNKIWKAKHRLVYEQQYGQLNSQDVVVFLDSNTLNCDVGNLYKTSKSIRCKMMRNEWFTSDPDVTKTAIKWCELEETLEKEGKKN